MRKRARRLVRDDVLAGALAHDFDLDKFVKPFDKSERFRGDGFSALAHWRNFSMMFISRSKSFRSTAKVANLLDSSNESDTIPAEVEEADDRDLF